MYACSIFFLLSQIAQMDDVTLFGPFFSLKDVDIALADR
jgi:hypothetical protein